MDSTMNISKNEEKAQLKLQIARYLEQQPETMQSFHRWMKRLEAAGMGLIAAAFITAMYISIRWTAVPPMMIAIAWFFFAASASPALVLTGLHAVVLRASPPVALPGNRQKFITGAAAAWSGWGTVLSGVANAAIWGLFAYSVMTNNLALLEPLIRIFSGVVGVGMAILILYSIFKKITKSL